MADTSYPAGGTTPLFLSTSSGLSEGYAAADPAALATGDLRRRYDFSERFSEKGFVKNKAAGISK